MAVSDIANLSGLILQIALSIQTTGSNWYKASADWDAFPGKVDKLRRERDFWVGKLTEYGLLSDKSLMETLRDAEVPLKEEQKRLLRRQSRYCAKCLSKVSMTMFPEQIGQKIQGVIDGFDAIIGQLEHERKVQLALEERVMQRAPSLAIRRTDHRYVPLKMSEDRVYSALDDPLGPPVVLLHGFPGKGKSTCARHIALHYHNTARSGPFEKVLFLDWVPKGGTENDLFLDLLHQLTGPSASQEPGQGEINSAATIRRRLYSFLKDQKLLIILDDVRDGEFLERMVDLCGVGVRCLVTSQRGDLCEGCSFSTIRIQIEDAQPEAAMDILASHVGFNNKQFPPHIEEVAKKIVHETRGNPLALASVATAIVDRPDDLEEWDYVYHNFSSMLRSMKGAASVLGERHSSGFWITMGVSLLRLEIDALKLLVLVCMCTAPSVPEEVFQVLYIATQFQDGFEKFKRARKGLESRELIKITSLDDGRSWSVHSLLKPFIQVEQSEWQEITFNELVAVPTSTESRVRPKESREFLGDEDGMIQTAICGLYFDGHFSERAASSIAVPLDRFDNLRRNAIEPITRLLGRPVSERWRTASQKSAKQVFWTYISNCALHNQGIVHLLALPISILPVLTALNDIASIEETCVLDGNSQGVIKRLVNLIEEDNFSDASMAKAAARAILQLSLNRLHTEILISWGILDTIVRILSSKYHPDLKDSLVQIKVSLSNA